MWLACETEEEIATSADLSERQVRSILAETKQEIAKLPFIPDSLQPYNLWSFSKAVKEYKKVVSTPRKRLTSRLTGVILGMSKGGKNFYFTNIGP